MAVTPPGRRDPTGDARRQTAAAYSATGAAWERGPRQVYGRLADAVVAQARPGLGRRLVLDLGCGTGAASRAVQRAGGRPLGVDAALGSLLVDRAQRPPAVVADVSALPFGDRCADGAVAAFVLNHLTEPAAALAEVRRVCRPGSPVVASVYADDDDHPVKRLVDGIAAELGWTPPAWYTTLRRDASPLLATPDRAVAVGRAAGLAASARRLRVDLSDLAPEQLVDWRLGMAQLAPFVAALPPGQGSLLRRRALAALGPAPPPLVRSIVVLTAVV